MQCEGRVCKDYSSETRSGLAFPLPFLLSYSKLHPISRSRQFGIIHAFVRSLFATHANFTLLRFIGLDNNVSRNRQLEFAQPSTSPRLNCAFGPSRRSYLPRSRQESKICLVLSLSAHWHISLGARHAFRFAPLAYFCGCAWQYCMSAVRSDLLRLL
jgi:hypothetical protein